MSERDESRRLAVGAGADPDACSGEAGGGDAHRGTGHGADRPDAGPAGSAPDVVQAVADFVADLVEGDGAAQGDDPGTGAGDHPAEPG